MNPALTSWLRVAACALAVSVAAPVAVVAGDFGAVLLDARWETLHRASQPGLVAATKLVLQPRGDVVDSSRARPERGLDLPSPWMIVVGFTGGLEGRNSSVSGVVQMRRKVGEHLGNTPGILTLTYNNFRWREARSDVLTLARDVREREDVRRADGDAFTVSRASLELEPLLRQPVIVVYGHSWGGGSIAKFARALGEEGFEVSLAIYIDAFTIRNPRLPANIRYAVNFYQRAGLLRGLPLRGKRQLIPESPASTIVLGNHQIRPATDHFGWNWNLIQPLLYRHHHRISHDVRLPEYLLRVIEVLEQRAAHDTLEVQHAATVGLDDAADLAAVLATIPWAE